MFAAGDSNTISDPMLMYFSMYFLPFRQKKYCHIVMFDMIIL